MKMKRPVEEEMDVVKRFVYDLVRELADKKLIDEGWTDTCEVLFDRKTRKSLEQSMKDAKEGNVTIWEPSTRVKKDSS